jgi:hypothetical protein
LASTGSTSKWKTKLNITALWRALKLKTTRTSWF